MMTIIDEIEGEVYTPEYYLKHAAVIHMCGGFDKIVVLKKRLKEANGRRKLRCLSWDICWWAVLGLARGEEWFITRGGESINRKQQNAVHYFSSDNLPKCSCLLAVRLDSERIVVDVRPGLAYQGHQWKTAFPEIEWSVDNVHQRPTSFSAYSKLSKLSPIYKWAEAKLAEDTNACK
jgi:hypothetical protein